MINMLYYESLPGELINCAYYIPLFFSARGSTQEPYNTCIINALMVLSVLYSKRWNFGFMRYFP